MSMDFGYDIVTADEYERQRLLYGPLTESLHRLIAAALHTDVDEDTVREAQASIDAVTEVLEREQRTATGNPRGDRARRRENLCAGLPQRRRRRHRGGRRRVHRAGVGKGCGLTWL
ncbi:hypothetical protein [Mycolicibacterium elephantis]|uniref:hypothetical protein n=1 Tax=Mycolicibacterium elephantis TaxID=81858 RepID=UPI0026BE1F09